MKGQCVEEVFGKLDAVLFAMINKFLNKAEFNQIKENLNIVRESIKNISDEKLQEIYDEVMTSKDK